MFHFVFMTRPSMQQVCATSMKQSSHVIFFLLQPTLTAFHQVVPEFAGTALEYLDKTLAEWGDLEKSGFKV